MLSWLAADCYRPIVRVSVVAAMMSVLACSAPSDRTRTQAAGSTRVEQPEALDEKVPRCGGWREQPYAPPPLDKRSLAPPPPDEAAPQAFKRGERAYDAGYYIDAALAFERSYQLSKIPLVLYNVGLARYRAEQYREAIRVLEKFLQLEPAHTATTKARRYLERAKEELRRRERPFKHSDGTACKPAKL